MTRNHGPSDRSSIATCGRAILSLDGVTDLVDERSHVIRS